MNTEIISGVFTSATVYKTDNPNNSIDQYARKQLAMLCDMEALSGSRIRVMPDVHPGKLGTIGFTATVGRKLMPLLIGVDIGCGMTVSRIKKCKKEWQKLDAIIRNRIPSGTSIHNKTERYHAVSFDYGKFRCRRHIRTDWADFSLGTLGSGNHFIEVDEDEEENIYLVIHSGSRHLGKEVSDYYMTEGRKLLKGQDIEVPYEHTWIEGELLDDYLSDVAAAREYAELNRLIITETILKGMKWKADEIWTCPHNYVEQDRDTLSLFGSPMLRKGAISAMKNRKVIIPINMKDGIILGTGLGNKEWNCSAPHGAGRILKREDVKGFYTVFSFKQEMKGIYSSCVGKDTLDEAPFAYRRMKDILATIRDTVRVDAVARPLYNYKAGGTHVCSFR